MSKVEFKVGDLVYYLTVTNAIIKLERNVHSENYCLLGEWVCCDSDKKCAHSFMSDGRISPTYQNPSAFPATQEWYDKLVHIYPDLEAPPKRKDPKQVIQAMLDDGKAGVVCYVSDKDPQPPRSINKELITVIDNNTEHMFYSYSNCFRYAVPFDLDTGKIIVDYVNGDVVLED